MTHHEMAKEMADTGMSRRDYRTGSVYQRASDGRWMGTIEAGFTESGARRRLTVSGTSKQQVQRKLRDKSAELDAAGHRNVKRSVTVAKWAETWLPMIQTQVRPSAYDVDKAAVRYIIAAIGSVRLNDLTPADVRSVAAKVRGKGKSSSTALRYHGTLMRLLKAAATDGYAIPPNVLLAKKPKAAVNDRAAIPAAQAITLITLAAPLPDASRWVLAFLQGLRQAEALGLTWEQVDLGVGTLTVSWQLKSLRYIDRTKPELGFLMPDGYEARHLVGAAHLVRPKSKAGWRVQPLVPWAVNALETWHDAAPDNPHDLVWPGRRQGGKVWPRNPASDRDAFAALQKRSGVQHPTGRPYTVHEIRHGTATLLMELGVPESVRVAIMGHSNITTTHGYEHVDLAQARLALERVAQRLQLG
jgi:integrase